MKGDAVDVGKVFDSLMLEREVAREENPADVKAGEKYVMDWSDEDGGLKAAQDSLFYRGALKRLMFDAGVASVPRQGRQLEAFRTGVLDGLIKRRFRDLKSASK